MANSSGKSRSTADDNCLLLFTSRSLDEIRRHGGSQAWVLNVQRARECRYVVCAWNPRGEYAQPNVNLRHGEAYLVAPITTIDLVEDPPGRYIVRFSEFAVPPDRKVVWTGKRNPVNYTTLSALKINVEDLAFASLDALMIEGSQAGGASARRRTAIEKDAPLTIAAAKRGLARQYGVEPDAIEIVIRG